MTARRDHGFDDVETVTRSPEDLADPPGETRFVLEVLEGADAGRAIAVDRRPDHGADRGAGRLGALAQPLGPLVVEEEVHTPIQLAHMRMLHAHM